MAVIIRAGVASDVPIIMSDIVHQVVPIMNSNNNYQWEIGKYPLESNFYSDIEKGTYSLLLTHSLTYSQVGVLLQRMAITSYLELQQLLRINQTMIMIPLTLPSHLLYLIGKYFEKSNHPYHCILAGCTAMLPAISSLSIS